MAAMVAGERDYRSILRDELETRCQKNPRYSLRAFARDLGISPSRLSEVLSGRYGLSSESAMAISARLGLSESEAELFRDLVEAKHARSKMKRSIAALKLQKHKVNPEYLNLQLDTFKIISDWYHFAILELTYLKEFKSDPRWIAKQLGISEHEATGAIERMKRLGLLAEKRGRLVCVEDFVATPSGIPSEHIKKYHRQVLERAARAVYMQSVDERDFSAMTLAFDSRRMAEAKKLLKEFRRRFNEQMREGTEKDSVYCLGLQFFRLNEKQGERK